MNARPLTNAEESRPAPFPSSVCLSRRRHTLARESSRASRVRVHDTGATALDAFPSSSSLDLVVVVAMSPRKKAVPHLHYFSAWFLSLCPSRDARPGAPRARWTPHVRVDRVSGMGKAAEDGRERRDGTRKLVPLQEPKLLKHNPLGMVPALVPPRAISRRERRSDERCRDGIVGVRAIYR